jgi:hypothetical protein
MKERGISMSTSSLIGSNGASLIACNGVIRNLRYPEVGKLRSREVVSRSNTRPTGKYPSFKMKRMLQWKTPHLLNAFRLLDANPAVWRFEEQPLVVHYELDGVEHDHYPDVKVEVDGEKELWDVATRTSALKPETARRSELLTKGLPAFGYRYRMVIAEDLAATSRLKNALTLLRHGRVDIPIIERERLRRQLATERHLTWSAILSGALGAQGKANACRLILEGTLRFDMSVPLCESTVISVVRSGDARQGASS